MDSRLHDEPRPPRADERDDARRPVEPLREVAADHVLALQRSAGNQAVSALLARAPAPAQPKEKAESAGGSGARVTLPGIGTIAVESVGLDAPGAGTGGASAHESVRQIMFTSRQG